MSVSDVSGSYSISVSGSNNDMNVIISSSSATIAEDGGALGELTLASLDPIKYPYIFNAIPNLILTLPQNTPSNLSFLYTMAEYARHFKQSEANLGRYEMSIENSLVGDYRDIQLSVEKYTNVVGEGLGATVSGVVEQLTPLNNKGKAIFTHDSSTHDIAPDAIPFDVTDFSYASIPGQKYSDFTTGFPWGSDNDDWQSVANSTGNARCVVLRKSIIEVNDAISVLVNGLWTRSGWHGIDDYQYNLFLPLFTRIMAGTKIKSISGDLRHLPYDKTNDLNSTLFFKVEGDNTIIMYRQCLDNGTNKICEKMTIIYD